MKEKFRIAGIKKILLTWHKHADLLDAADPARALYGPPPKTAAGERGRSLVDFFKQVFLFEDLTQADLRQLARIVHERTYRDGEYIFEEGKPGTALYIVRSGVVEIMRRKRNGEEVSLVLVEPPASFEELAAAGADVVHWTSAGLAALSPWLPSAVPTWMTSVVTFHSWRIKFSRIWPASSP